MYSKKRSGSRSLVVKNYDLVGQFPINFQTGNGILVCGRVQQTAGSFSLSLHNVLDELMLFNRYTGRALVYDRSLQRESPTVFFPPCDVSKQSPAKRKNTHSLLLSCQQELWRKQSVKARIIQPLAHRSFSLARRLAKLWGASYL